MAAREICFFQYTRDDTCVLILLLDKRLWKTFFLKWNKTKSFDVVLSSFEYYRIGSRGIPRHVVRET